MKIRAAGYATTGGHDVLRMVDLPLRDPGAGEVRVRILYSGANPTDWKTRTGGIHMPIPDGRVQVPHLDGSGIVDAVGPGVGDRPAKSPGGSGSASPATSRSEVSPSRPGRSVYLSPEHRDNPGDGCPSAALLDEIGRCGDETKNAYTDGARAIVEELAARLAPEDPQSARGQAIGLYTMAVGTLQLSRALSDRKLSDEVLEKGIENVLAFMR